MCLSEGARHVGCEVDRVDTAVPWSRCFEDVAEPAPGPVETSASGDDQAAEDLGHLGRGEALPLGEEQDLAVPWAELRQRLVHERLFWQRRHGCRRPDLWLVA